MNCVVLMLNDLYHSLLDSKSNSPIFLSNVITYILELKWVKYARRAFMINGVLYAIFTSLVIISACFNLRQKVYFKKLTINTPIPPRPDPNATEEQMYEYTENNKAGRYQNFHSFNNLSVHLTANICKNHAFSPGCRGSKRFVQKYIIGNS